MRHTLFLTLCIMMVCFFSSCKKNNNQIPLPEIRDAFVSEGLHYLKDQISAADLKTLDFGSIQTIKDSNNNTVIFFIAVLNTHNQQSIVITKSENEFTGNWLTYEFTNSSGYLHTRSLDDQTKKEVTFVDGNPVNIVSEIDGQTTTTLIKYPGNNAIQTDRPTVTRVENGVQTSETGGPNYITLQPVVITAYVTNYNSTNLLYSLYWATGQNTGFSYQYSLTPPSPGGGSTNKSAYIQSAPGPNRVGNVPDYFKCFTNRAGAEYTYKITVCVDQPIAKNRSPWGFSLDGTPSSSGLPNPINPGHTFLILTQTTPTSTITRNIGFYAESKVTPMSPMSDGEMNNNESYKNYDISLTATVNNSQFFTMLNYIERTYYNGLTYDLSMNNCTTFAINSMRQAGINIPATYGT